MGSNTQRTLVRAGGEKGLRGDWVRSHAAAQHHYNYLFLNNILYNYRLNMARGHPAGRLDSMMERITRMAF